MYLSICLYLYLLLFIYEWWRAKDFQCSFTVDSYAIWQVQRTLLLLCVHIFTVWKHLLLWAVQCQFHGTVSTLYWRSTRLSARKTRLHFQLFSPSYERHSNWRHYVSSTGWFSSSQFYTVGHKNTPIFVYHNFYNTWPILIGSHLVRYAAVYFLRFSCVLFGVSLCLYELLCYIKPKFRYADFCVTSATSLQLARDIRGVDPYDDDDDDDTSPNIWTGGGIVTNVPLPGNISRVISATFYPCNIFLISWKSF